MNYHKQKRTADAIDAANLARITAAGLAVALAIKGDWIGTSVLAITAAGLYLALPVTR